MIKGLALEEPGGKQMNTEERTTVIELNNEELETVTGGDKNTGGTKTAAPQVYLQFKLTEVFVTSIH
jgi:bacteriocin-like protein